MTGETPTVVWRPLPPVPAGLLEQARERFYGATDASDQAQDIWSLAQALMRLADAGEDRLLGSVSPEFMRALDQAARIALVCAQVRPTAQGPVLSVWRPELLIGNSPKQG